MLQKRPHEPGLVGGEIVENDVDLLAGWAQGNDFLQKGNEVLTSMACGGLSMDTARGSIQCCIQRERSMPVVFEPMALDAARRKRQNRIAPIKCLNRRLLINAEYRGMLRRVQIQPDNVRGFSLEVRISRRS